MLQSPVTLGGTMTLNDYIHGHTQEGEKVLMV
jgi:hypothetical protein